MKRLLAVALAALWLACPNDKPARAAGLHVPIPDGWEARGRGASLEAGPAGHTLLTLQSRDAPLPSVDALVAATAAEGVVLLEKEASDSFVAAHYSLLPDTGVREGFVAVKAAGARTVWCASTADASPAQVREGLEICRAVTITR